MNDEVMKLLEQYSNDSKESKKLYDYVNQLDFNKDTIHIFETILRLAIDNNHQEMIQNLKGIAEKNIDTVTGKNLFYEFNLKALRLKYNCFDIQDLKKYIVEPLTNSNVYKSSVDALIHYVYEYTENHDILFRVALELIMFIDTETKNNYSYEVGYYFSQKFLLEYEKLVVSRLRKLWNTPPIKRIKKYRDYFKRKIQ